MLFFDININDFFVRLLLWEFCSLFLLDLEGVYLRFIKRLRLKE